ncbi:hypothetical protein MJO28_014031 [Puccinia striiformis f. sp. tritici]|uniref:Uncharacterized protein n=1 Tax=Puccinia striiformis f. sp. tritici TaxID=168172 RepID=A0ACC0DY58_9BASI|nr:hypothetical protein MJO28_014031 [Puccinia striiformis f. sp. tritici]
MDESGTETDVSRANLPAIPNTSPPASAFLTFLSGVLGNPNLRSPSGDVLIKQDMLNLIQEMILVEDTRLKKMESCMDTIDGRIALLELSRQPSAPNMSHPAKPSYARAAGAHAEPSRPNISPPSRPSLQSFKPAANNFGAGDLVKIKWLADNSATPKQASSIVLSLRNKETANRCVKSGIYLNWGHHRVTKFIPRPPQCWKCLKMGHFGQWCRENARCEVVAQETQSLPTSMIDTTNVTSNPTSFPPFSSSSPFSPPPPILNSILPMAPVKILQLNCHAAKAVTLSVLKLSSDFSILALQEPWVNATFLPPNHPDWLLFTAFEHLPTDFHDRHRTCIYVRKGFGLDNINQLSGGGQFLTGLKISISPSKTICILNAYNTPGSFPALSILDDWLEAFYSRSTPTFICMDANLHHPHWNPIGVSNRDPNPFCQPLGDLASDSPLRDRFPPSSQEQARVSLLTSLGPTFWHPNSS